MIDRQLQPVLQHRLARYPVVTITGPRQSGKTTLARMHQGQREYVNLEAIDTRKRLAADPRSFFAHCPHGAILDEVQRLPDILSYLQVHVDEMLFQNREAAMGQFILTGSHQLKLHESISQSLAGRTSVLELLPYSLAEINDDLPLDERLFRGFMPGAPSNVRDCRVFHQDYITTYIERDVRDMMKVQELNYFHDFLVHTMARVGNLINLQSLTNTIGISATTLKRWLSVLDASYLVFKLQPFSRNIGKRLSKTPKIYATDVGLACTLLNITDPLMLAKDRLRGALFENLVVLEVLKAFTHAGETPKLSFFRDQSGLEVDLLIESRDRIFPIEIKSSQTFDPDMLAPMKRMQALLGSSEQGCLVYAGKTLPPVHGIEIINYRDIHHLIKRQCS